MRRVALQPPAQKVRWSERRAGAPAQKVRWSERRAGGARWVASLASSDRAGHVRRVQPHFSQLAAHAARHHGIFRIGDARGAGVSRQQVRTLVAAGWCALLSPGVYRVCAAPTTDHQRVLAEVWSHPPGAVASHRAAAYIWRLLGFHRAVIDVTVPTGRNQRPTDRVRTSLWLPAQHITTRDAIPVTRVARTIFDLAGVEPIGRTKEIIDDAMARGLCTQRQLDRVFFALARRGRRGTAAMREILEDMGPGYVAPASELERVARKLFADRGLPTPRFEVHLGDDDLIGRVDCTWSEARLVVELDSRRFHGSPGARDRDRRRDNRLVAAGWRVIRVTWDDLKERPDEVVAQIRSALAMPG